MNRNSSLVLSHASTVKVSIAEDKARMETVASWWGPLILGYILEWGLWMDTAKCIAHYRLLINTF